MNRICFVILVTLVVGVGSPRPILAAAVEDDIGSGQILFSNGTSAVHLKSHADIKVSGLIAKVLLTQTFRNDSDEWQEAVYVLPMPDGAAVSAMTMKIGERVVKAEIKEKQEAKKIYYEAKAAGKKASLVEQGRPNLFQQKVANIAPREEIRVEIGYVQTIDYKDGSFVYRLPMTLTPRFMPALGEGETASGTDIWIANAQFAEAADDEILNPMSISMSLDAGFKLKRIKSIYHKIKAHRSNGLYEINFVDGEVSMDRDLVISWQTPKGDEPKAAVFREEIAGEDYVLLMMVPPDHSEHVQPLARDMIFVIDTSGSMEGTSIDQAKESLRNALLSLRPQDRFNIIEFNSSWSALFSQIRPVDSYNLSVAKSWVDSLAAGGGTNMLPALTTAMSSHEESGYLQHIVFITDGAVGNEANLFETIDRKLGNARLFPVGIGSAPNTFFMRQAAKFGRGTYTHIGDLNEVGIRMEELFRKIDSPIATEIEVTWPTEVESYPAKIPDLYLGEPLLVVAKGNNLTGDVQVTGMTAASGWHEGLPVDTKQRHDGVGTVWARRKLEALNDAEVKGADPKLIREQIIEVALNHHLVSRFTSLVAVEEYIARKPQEKLKSGQVPNAAAQGQVRFPRTATSAAQTFIIGLLALLMLVMIRIVGNRRILG